RGARAGKRNGRWRAAAVFGRDRHLHLSRLPDPQRRRAADQLPPARIDPADAGLGLRRPRAHPGRLRPRGPRALPLLLVRRRDAAAGRGVRPLIPSAGSRVAPVRGASVEADEYNSHFGWASRRRPPPHRKESPMRPFHAARAACAAIMALSLMAACGRQDAPDAAQPGTDAADPGEVNLYTTREPGLIQPLLDAFTASSGIEVNTVFVRDGLLERVRAEGERSPADVLMTVDTGNLLDL